MRIFYLVPDNKRPSWGLGIIFHHVKILKENGFNSFIAKDGATLDVPGWLNMEVPIIYASEIKHSVKSEDVIVFPEVMMSFPGLKQLRCRKILFIQSSGYLFESMPPGEDHISLGFEHVFIIMPHMIPIVQKTVQLPYTIIPPFVSEYFFCDDLTRAKKKQILIYPKLSQIDYSLVKYLIGKDIRNRKGQWIRDIFETRNWRIKELKNLSHEEVAAEMKKSAFFISLNLFEALNTSVVEAMAAGCLVFCYEGIGPRDYLINKTNAMVFGNNEAYQLAEDVCDWIENYEEREEELLCIRHKAYETAQRYKLENCRVCLYNFFNGLK